jgi:hypothetical protein
MRRIYCHLWPLRLYHIFPHYLINGRVFGKTITKHEMFASIFFTTFVRNTLHKEEEKTKEEEEKE